MFQRIRHNDGELKCIEFYPGENEARIKELREQSFIKCFCVYFEEKKRNLTRIIRNMVSFLIFLKNVS